jgi:hypothetical protein
MCLASPGAALPPDGRPVSDWPGRAAGQLMGLCPAGEARKEIESLSRGKAQPFHTSGGTAANTLNTYRDARSQVNTIENGSRCIHLAYHF